MNRKAQFNVKNSGWTLPQKTSASAGLLLAAGCLLASLANPAQAQSAGSFSVSAGATSISPSVRSGSLTSLPLAGTVPNAQVDIGSNSQFSAAINYMATDAVNLHIPLSFGFRHDVFGAGSIAGTGKLGDTRVLPITLIAQYRFLEANAGFRPYVGLGLTYASFYKERGTGLLTALTNPGGPATTLSFKDKLAPTLQIGAVAQLTNKWYIEGSYSKTFLKTQANLNTGQSIDVRLNPDVLTLQVGYKF